MADMSREELDAKLHGVSARTEGLVAEMRAIVDGLVRRMDERDAVNQRIWTERYEAQRVLWAQRDAAQRDALAQRYYAERQALELRQEAYQREWAEYKSALAERDAISEQRVQRIEKNADEIRILIENQKRTMIVTAVTAVIATVLGVGSFNAALQSNILSALSMGKESTAILADAANLNKQAIAILTEAIAQNRKATAQSKEAAELAIRAGKQNEQVLQFLERTQTQAAAPDRRRR